MMTEQNKYLSGQALDELCKNLIPDRDNLTLSNRLRAFAGHDKVRLARVGDEWYKVGGIVDADGKRISHDLIEWTERTYLECGQNLQVIIDHILEQRLLATRISGRTLYFVIETGNQAQDFCLIEIDKLQEMSDRLLIDENNLPESLEDIIDPFQPEIIDNYSLGPASYQYRRKTEIATFMAALASHHADIHPVQRFIDDWNRSSAAKVAFSKNWLIRPLRHIGRYGEQIMNVELINLHGDTLPHFDDLVGSHGSTLHSILKRFDRRVGYPFAWYFCMVNGLVSSTGGEAVYRDITGDFAYLPEDDEAVLRAWMADPYYIR